MKIKLKDIGAPALHDFLAWLQASEIDNIVVLGGAVRDTIIGCPLKDIDIALRLPVLSPTNVRLYRDTQQYEILPSMNKVLVPLTGLLNCGRRDFCTEDGIPFKNTTVDLLGMVVVEDTSGMCYPDIFVDSRNDIFGAYNELSVNRIAIDRNGEIWPELNISHLQNRVGSLAKGPLGINLRVILRALRTCKYLNLRLESEAVGEMMDYLHSRGIESFNHELSDPRIALIATQVFDKSNTKMSGETTYSVIKKIEKLIYAMDTS